MAAVSGAATASAVTPTTVPVIDGAWSVNQPSGATVSVRWPGPVNTPLYSDRGYTPTSPGTVGDPIQQGAQPFSGRAHVLHAEGGGYIDTAYLTGHDAPVEPWDSSAGLPFSQVSGPVNPDLHAIDTGAVYQFETVVPAEIGKLERRTMVGQTTVRNGTGDQVMKDNQTAPNARINFDQQQWHNPDGGEGGWAPWSIPYAERPIYNNIAYESEGITPTGTKMTPSGYLPDRSPFYDTAQAYEAPPDPAVTVAPVPTAASDNGIGGGWL